MKTYISSSFMYTLTFTCSYKNGITGLLVTMASTSTTLSLPLCNVIHPIGHLQVKLKLKVSSVSV